MSRGRGGHSSSSPPPFPLPWRMERARARSQSHQRHFFVPPLRRARKKSIFLPKKKKKDVFLPLPSHHITSSSSSWWFFFFADSFPRDLRPGRSLLLLLLFVLSTTTTSSLFFSGLDGLVLDLVLLPPPPLLCSLLSPLLFSSGAAAVCLAQSSTFHCLSPPSVACFACCGQVQRGASRQNLIKCCNKFSGIYFHLVFFWGGESYKLLIYPMLKMFLFLLELVTLVTRIHPAGLFLPPAPLAFPPLLRDPVLLPCFPPFLALQPLFLLSSPLLSCSVLCCLCCSLLHLVESFPPSFSFSFTPPRCRHQTENKTANSNPERAGYRYSAPRLIVPRLIVQLA